MRSTLDRALRIVLPATFPALLVTPAAAQVFGNGCPGWQGGVPELTVDELVLSDSTFTIKVEGAPNQFGYLVVGVSNEVYQGFSLPLDLTAFGFNGCSLLVSNDLVWPILTDGDGLMELELPGFGGFDVIHMQALMGDYDENDFDPPAGFSKGVTVTGVDPTYLQPGDIVFTEVMRNPSFVTDGVGEWFELFNTTDADIDINRWTVADGGTDFVDLNAGGPLIVPAQSFVILGNNADPATNGGIDVLFDYSGFGSLNLSNSVDSLILSTPDENEIDRIEWDSGELWPFQAGRSMQLIEGVFEGDLNDDGANWETSECYIGGTPFNTDRGTPGTATGDCLFPTLPFGSGELIFSEIMQNPSSVSDTYGEWFEVHNTTAGAIDMVGYRVSLGGGEFTVEGSFVVPPGGYGLFARDGDAGANGGLPAGAYDYPDEYFLPNGSQTMTILDPAGSTVCLLLYDNGATFPDPSGESMTLDPAKLEIAMAVDGTSWCEGTTPYGDGDLGTPGAANDPCNP